MSHLSEIPTNDSSKRETDELEIRPAHGNTSKEKDQTGPMSSSSASSAANSRRKAHKIETLEDFIQYAYSRSGQKIVLKSSVEKALCRQPKLEAEARKRLLELAKNDLLLAVPRQLLLAFRDIMGYPILKNEVRNFVGDVLSSHPIFSSPELNSTLRNLPEAPEPQRALIALTAIDISTIAITARGKPLKHRDFEELRTNAIYCLIVWFVETRSLSFEKLSQYLFLSLWKSQRSIAEDETTRLRYLTEIRDLVGVGLACSVFKEQADEQARFATSARKAQEVALNQVAALQVSIEQLRMNIEERDRQISNLTKTADAERQSHEHTRTHLRDDFEQMRARLVRRLTAEATLLSEGLHALRRDTPKIHVMEDHAERVLEGLNEEIRELALRIRI